MAQLVEQRIRNAWVAGSSPAIGSFHTGVRTYVLTPVVLKTHYFLHADSAQLVEHWLPKPRVAGSSPVIRSFFISPEKVKRNFFIHGTHGEHGFSLKILLKIFVKMSSRKAIHNKTLPRSEELERILVKDFC